MKTSHEITDHELRPHNETHASAQYDPQVAADCQSLSGGDFLYICFVEPWWGEEIRKWMTSRHMMEGISLAETQTDGLRKLVFWAR